MAHDVIMPALGMAQDTGLLVAWRKAPGDKVAAGEPLFEVETDKATMEVEAAASGFLSSVTAGNGADVPVGQVIARIVDTEAEVAAAPPQGKTAAPPAPVEAPPKAAVAAAPVPTPVKAAPPKPPAPPPMADSTPAPRPAVPPARDGKILASPKARRLAEAEGLDLGRLARSGHPQPYHVADLDKLRPMTAARARSVMGARADGTALQALLKKAAAGTDAARIFAAFARGSWRHVTGQDDLSATLLRADGSRDDEGGALLLIDLTGTRLTSYAPPDGLALTVTTDAQAISLTLAFDDDALPFATASAWLDELAARIEDPLRQLV